MGGNGSSYAVTRLASDAAGATYGDPNLVNGWGLAFNPQGFAWVADAGSSKSTLYDGNGILQSPVVSIPAGQAGPAMPTGVVYNASQDFVISQGGNSAPALFVFVGLAGTVSGWSPSVSAGSAVTVVDGAASQSMYTGVALAAQGSANYLYAADFRNGVVDVFDRNFTKQTMPGAFTDPTLPAGYAPFGIQAIGGNVLVSYAKQDPATFRSVAGAGLGVVDMFDSAGHLIKQLVPAGAALDAPWGMAMAPANFGPLSSALLVANFGDGKVNAFNPTTGAFLGTLSDALGAPLVIDGLWGIAFGNGLNNQPSNTLFFAAGPAAETQGLFGRIDSR